MVYAASNERYRENAKISAELMMNDIAYGCTDYQKISDFLTKMLDDKTTWNTAQYKPQLDEYRPLAENCRRKRVRFERNLRNMNVVDEWNDLTDLITKYTDERYFAGLYEAPSLELKQIVLNPQQQKSITKEIVDSLAIGENNLEKLIAPTNGLENISETPSVFNLIVPVPPGMVLQASLKFSGNVFDTIHLELVDATGPVNATGGRKKRRRKSQRRTQTKHKRTKRR